MLGQRIIVLDFKNGPLKFKITILSKVINVLVSKFQLHMGNINAVRDWGHAKDFVEVFGLFSI